VALVPVPSKEVVREIEDGARSFFGIVQRFLRLTADQKEQGVRIEKQAAEIKAQAARITAQAEEIAALRDELHTLKAREELVLVRAESAATLAASHSIADLARRIGHLEATRENREQ